MVAATDILQCQFDVEAGDPVPLLDRGEVPRSPEAQCTGVHIGSRDDLPAVDQPRYERVRDVEKGDCGGPTFSSHLANRQPSATPSAERYCPDRAGSTAAAGDPAARRRGVGGGGVDARRGPTASVL